MENAGVGRYAFQLLQVRGSGVHTQCTGQGEQGSEYRIGVYASDTCANSRVLCKPSITRTHARSRRKAGPRPRKNQLGRTRQTDRQTNRA